MAKVETFEGLPGEVDTKEAELARAGYCKTRAASADYLDPGEYLLESAPQAVSAAEGGPCVRAITWRPRT
jgi:hypothetical protein